MEPMINNVDNRKEKRIISEPTPVDYKIFTVGQANRVKNGLVYQYPNESWSSQGITGHVDVVFRRQWASMYMRNVTGAPYNNHRTEIFH